MLCIRARRSVSRHVKPLSSSRVPFTFTLLRSKSFAMLSPSSACSANDGAGTKHGRQSALASSVAKSICRALPPTMLKGPCSAGRSRMCTIAATASARLVHDMNCVPRPRRPPRPRRNGSSILPRAPRPAANTTPIRKKTHWASASRARAAASHWMDTSARNESGCAGSGVCSSWTESESA
eukprot:6187489-Pleurochrysis_carterae.AAC.1